MSEVRITITTAGGQPANVEVKDVSQPLTTERLPNGIVAHHHSVVAVRIFLPSGMPVEQARPWLAVVERLGFSTKGFSAVPNGGLTALFAWEHLDPIPDRLWPEATAHSA